ncbi:MAG: MerR family transcriptional regulator [Bacteroidota bacterium]
MNSDLHDRPIFSISAAARMLGVSVQTLRLYEDEGLLVISKTEGRQRRYSRADIDRIECIRRAINEEKISIGGMQHIHGLIPCWDMFHCSEKERSDCPAFKNHSGGCWTYEHSRNACAGKDCRLCTVYKFSSDCKQIKELIIRSSLHHRVGPNV